MNFRSFFVCVSMAVSLSAFASPKEDCAADAEKFCKLPAAAGAKGEMNGKPRGCLREHLSELSPGCKAHFERTDKMRKEGHKKAPETQTHFTPKTRVQLYAMLADKDVQNQAPQDELNGSLLESFFGFDDEIQHDDPETKEALSRARKAAGLSAQPEDDASATVRQ